MNEQTNQNIFNQPEWHEASFSGKCGIFAKHIWNLFTSGDSQQQNAAGCLIIFVLAVIVIVPYCTYQAMFVSTNRHGVPKEIVRAIEADLEANGRYEKMIPSCRWITWYTPDYITPTKTTKGEVLQNKYTVEGQATGKTNAFGTYQEAVVNARYEWDPQSKTVTMYDLDVFGHTWDD